MNLTTRERKALESLRFGDWESEAMLNPGQVGEGTIAKMQMVGWIERRVQPSGIKQARITEAGKEALNTPPLPKPTAKIKLKTLQPRLKPLPPRF